MRAPARLRARRRGGTTVPAELPPAVEDLIGATGRFIIAQAGGFGAGRTVPWSERAQRRAIAPGGLPVAAHLPQLLAAAPPDTRPLVQALQDAAHLLEWRQTYGPAQVSQRFLDNYGWSELAGPAGPVPSTELAAGFLILGPGIEYPPHHHEAPELYRPLAGRAAWWRPRGGWHEVAPGETVCHACWEPHAMRTGVQPMLALYLWRGENLDGHAELDESVQT